MSKETTKYWLKLVRAHHVLVGWLVWLIVMLMIGVAVMALIWSKQPQVTAPASITETGVTIQTYQVQVGDSSWSVAQQFLGDGFRYIEIEQANDLVHNQHLAIGQELIIPQDEIHENTPELAPEPTIIQPTEVIPQPTENEISAPNTYLVKPGDSLWQIASDQYGDGSSWTEIYRANSDQIGSNPGLIYPHTEIVLPTLL
jgi:nucleoid-associated protein YgaU